MQMQLIQCLSERNAKMRSTSKIKLLIFQTAILVRFTCNYLVRKKLGVQFMLGDF